MRNSSNTDREGGKREGGREPPLVPELEMGQDGQEYFGAHWLKCEICKPCSASCVLFLAPTGCSCMCAGRHKAEWEGMTGRNGQ